MGPEQAGAYRSMDDALLKDDAALQAARKAFAGRHDIIPVWGGFIAVPDGTQVVLATTIGGLTAKLSRMEAAEAEDPR